MVNHVILLGEVQVNTRAYELATDRFAVIGKVAVLPNILRGGNLTMSDARIAGGGGAEFRMRSTRGGEVSLLYDDAWVLSAIEQMVFGQEWT